ncbi:periplasmic chaperone for outer membrane proteins Skp [Fodinibius roseus]|uniref:Periplasmic chaperone for outer membrane proteins Skp n=1 Tax=Fodinibius roseus TaxID=1194090 RepID=A0A1M5IMN9_9BACT|nr:OmpH family outer membrane protein [Fodinibius roseus]SHG29624.1 periplasmic chaperone for outer membrane proteins Skp [Fodinibius roseus]
MVKNILVAAACFSLVTFTNVFKAHAQQQLKFGYVDRRAILNKMPEMKAVQQRIQNFIDQKREQLEKKQSDFQQRVTEYQQKMAVVSDDVKKKEEAHLGQLQEELQQYQTQLAQVIQQKQEELIGPLLQQIQQAISKVAAEQGLMYVFNIRTTNDVVILYASEEAQKKYNISNLVMQELGI